MVPTILPLVQFQRDNYEELLKSFLSLLVISLISNLISLENQVKTFTKNQLRQFGPTKILRLTFRSWYFKVERNSGFQNSFDIWCKTVEFSDCLVLAANL